MDLVDILAGLGPDNLAEKRKALMQWRINSAMGMLAPTTGTGVEAATRMLPMTGEAWTANDAGNAIQEGQYGKAAMMGLLGLLPLGGMMSAGLRAGASVPKRMGQSGAIAWHGSPHKFDKFSLDKIGTGEGAQAYGHGLYLAESPDVAKSYQTTLTMDRGFNFGGKSGLTREQLQDLVNAREGGKYLDGVTKPSGVADQVIDSIVYGKNGELPRGYKYGSERAALFEKLKQEITHTDEGALYKTDIPDEAVARFLDWDKPLSQQNEFVQSIIARQHGVSLDNYRKMMKLDPDKFDKTGKEMVSSYRGAQPDEVTSDLFANGIPGIRYLDGGSRGAGQGSSNFVAFDPELIRILERNGIPTGNQPWKPGEWQGMLSGTK